MNDVATVVDTPNGIALAQMCALKGALKLEVIGMRRSGGKQSAYSIVKQKYGLRGNRASVLKQLQEHVDSVIKQTNTEVPLVRNADQSL